MYFNAKLASTPYAQVAYASRAHPSCAVVHQTNAAILQHLSASPAPPLSRASHPHARLDHNL